MLLRSRIPFIAVAALCVASQLACNGPAATSTSDDVSATGDAAIADVLAVDSGTDTAVTPDIAGADVEGGATDAVFVDLLDAVDSAPDAADDAATVDVPADAADAATATDVAAVPDSGTPGSDAVDVSPDADVAAGTDAVAVCDPAACPQNACQSAVCKSDGSCGLGPVKTCNDGNVCTDDSCDGALGCVFAPNQATCNDGDACTTVDACAAGTCVGGAPVVCDAVNDCHVAGVCDPKTGACSNFVAADGTGCDDGNACTGADDACLAGVCGAGTPLACAASDVCHLSLGCDPASGCLGETPVTCTALDACHDAGICDTGGTTDAGGNVLPSGCTNPPKALYTPCEDGNPCTVEDYCDSGACLAGYPFYCASSDACHLPGVCLPATGACTNPVGPDGGACNDGQACSGIDSCVAGKCLGVGFCEEYQAWATTCYDSNSNAWDAVVGPPDATDICGDLGVVWGYYGIQTMSFDLEFAYDIYASSPPPNTLTVRETCGGGVVKLELRDSNYNLHEVWSGTDPTPESIADFRITFAQQPYSITGARITMNNNAGFGLDAVSLGFVKQPCSTYTYDVSCGCLVDNAANGTTCSDGNGCTANDACQSGTCTSGATYLCDDNNGCTADACTGTGTCTHTPVPGTSCNGYGTFGVDVVNGVPTASIGTVTSKYGLQKVDCPAGSVAVGFSGSAWQYLYQLRLDCAPLAADGTLGDITTTAGLGVPNNGDPGGTHCPSNSMLASLDGVLGNNGSNLLVAISGRCLHPYQFSELISATVYNAWGTPTVTDAGSPNTVQNALGGSAAFFGKQLSVACPPGSAVTGVWGYVGNLPQTIAAICSPITSVCASSPAIGCSDGDACTSGDSCSGGSCKPSGPTNCDDGYPFTLDSCDKTAGCVHVAGPTVKIDEVCGTASEVSALALQCPPGGYIASVKFASYGSGSGQCPNFTAGTCDASGEVAYLNGQCVGKNSCSTTGWQSLNKNWSASSDPCAGAAKSMNAVVVCWSQDDCKDGIQNGAESAIDCGGSVCPGCKAGQACTGIQDCDNGYCGLKDKVCH